ncbi:globin domain-containing protein [Maritimibacter alexandrii]|jgi:hemoglobin-like flavoprotein|uniref:globin domain-containing protein n=1 Tax=Maritimibacter alexandrii TaxID=2570355 RepID=UPI0014861B78|nr:globin domain-containing protein [Maritimibacter alexandrii]
MPFENAGLIRACLSDLYSVRIEFSRRFYDRFFEQVPEARRLFVHNQDKQALMLYAAVAMTMRGMESGRDLDGELIEFGKRHARLGVKQDMFPIFGSTFLETLIEYLPHHDHPKIAKAWWGGFTDMSTPIIAGMIAEQEEMMADKRLFRKEAEESAVIRLGRRMEATMDLRLH